MTSRRLIHALASGTALIGVLSASPALSQKAPASPVLRVNPSASATSAPVEMQDGSGHWRPIGTLNPTTGDFAPQGLPAVSDTAAAALAGANAAVPRVGGVLDATVSKHPGATVAVSEAQRLLMRPFTPADFGGVCDGATDATAAVRAAFSAVASAGGEIDLPGPNLCVVNTDNGGPLLITGTVTVTVRGVNGGGLLNVSTGGADTIYIGGDSSVVRGQPVLIRDAKIWGQGHNGSGIHARLATNLKIIHAGIYNNGNIGIFGDATYAIVVDQSTISQNGPAGVYLNNNGGNGARITSNTVTAHNGAGVSIDTAYAAFISGNDIELNTRGIRLRGVTGAMIAGNYQENNLTGNVEVDIDNSNKGVSVIGNTFFGYSAMSANGLTVTGNTFIGVLSTGPFTNVVDFTGALNLTTGGNNLPAGSKFTAAALEQRPGPAAATKATVPDVGPGAGVGQLVWTTGTNAGTCKLVALAGTSATPVTIADNVGSGC